jgi:hypothetical protein
MRRATITITDELARAVERYRRDLEVRPALAAVVQTALREYLVERGYLLEEVDAELEDELIPSSGGKPGPLEDAPKLRSAKKTVADAVIEDRR